MLPPRYASGFQHFNSVSHPNTKIEIGEGRARDSINAVDINAGPGILDLATVGADGWDGGSIPPGSWGYSFVIAKDDGNTAFLASLSPTAPTLPSSYTAFRRVGAFKLNSSGHVIPFIHVNEHWYWASTIRDKSAAADVGPTIVSQPVSVPRVVGVTALLCVTGWNAGGVVAVNLFPGFLPDTAAVGFTYNFGTSNGGTLPARVMVGSAASVKIKSSASATNLVIDTAGWVDPL